VKTLILNEEAVDELLAAIKYAKRSNHRVLLALTGNNEGNLVLAAVEALNLFLTIREP